MNEKRITKNKRGEKVITKSKQQAKRGLTAPYGSDEQERLQKEAAIAYNKAKAEREAEEAAIEEEGREMTRSAVHDIKEQISARMRDVPVAKQPGIPTA